MKTKLFLTGLAIIAVVTIANGQNSQTENKQSSSPGKAIAYVDENKNGVCDNFENRPGNTRSTQGICYYRGGKGDGKSIGNCCGRGPCKRQGQGRGINFVDKNDNGICDKFETQTGSNAEIK